METHLDKTFIGKIDCNFPFYNKEDCLLIVNEAAALSSNAMFRVIEEICRITLSDKGKVTTDFLLNLLSETENRFNHPLKEMILDAAAKMLNGQTLTVDEAILRMQSIKDYNGQFGALSIVYFACDDKEDRLDLLWDNIISDWNRNGIQFI